MMLTIVHYLIQFVNTDDTEMVSFLIKNGVNPNKKFSESYNYGCAHHFNFQSLEMAKIFVSHGVKISDNRFSYAIDNVRFDRDPELLNYYTSLGTDQSIFLVPCYL
jgi:hypothetical protein